MFNLSRRLVGARALKILTGSIDENRNKYSEQRQEIERS